MSTILEALRRLQRDRERTHEPESLHDSVMSDFDVTSDRARHLPWVLSGGFALLAGIAFAIFLYFDDTAPEEPTDEVAVTHTRSRFRID